MDRWDVLQLIEELEQKLAGLVRLAARRPLVEEERRVSASLERRIDRLRALLESGGSQPHR